MKTTGNTILITGGGSGVGLALAKALLSLNNRVVITGRDANKLIQAQNTCPGLHTITCDIRNEGACRRLAEDIQAKFAGLNILINNAAVATLSDIRSETFVDNAVDEMTTNFIAPLRLTHLLLDVLCAQTEAAVVNVSTPAALLPMSVMPGYCASKSALHSLSQSLRGQLRGTNLRVIEMLLPPVDTHLVEDFDVKKRSADSVAAEMIRELRKGRSFVPIGQVKFLLSMFRFLPRLSEVLIGRFVSKSLGR